MRKILTTLIILSAMLFFKTAKSQSFTPYLDSTSTWYDYYGGGNQLNETHIHSIFYFNGDTFLLGNNYYKLFWSRNDSTFSWGNLSSVTDTNYYEAAIREDSLKRIYLIYANQTNEKLLFDFNFSVGDTVPDMESNYGCNNPPMTVVSIDTVYLGSQPLKNFHFPPNWMGKTLIEGVGGTAGFIWIGAFCFHPEAGSCLVAYKKGIDSLFVNCGQGTTGIAETSKKNSTNIYPNPATTTLNFILSKQENITIINLLGEILIKKNLSFNPQGIVEIDISTLSSGIYFMKAGNEVWKFAKE